MAEALDVTPNPVYYTFDAVNGLLCERSGDPWMPANPDYDPGPPPPPKPPKIPDSASTPDTNGSDTKAAAPASVGRPAFFSVPTTFDFDFDRRRGGIPNGGAGYYTSLTPPMFDPSHSRPEILNRAGSHSSSTLPTFDSGRTPSRSSQSTLTPLMFDSGRHRLEIPNGGVSYTPPPPRRQDPMSHNGRKVSTNEPERPRPTKSRHRRPRRDGGGGRKVEGVGKESARI